MDSLKPILVHIHVFYSYLWEEIQDCVQQIPYKFELFVTLAEQCTDIYEEIKEAFPRANIKVVKNLGYDVGPFIDLLSEVDLDNYSFVLKLHTKRDMPNGAKLKYFDVSGSKWRDYALSSFRTRHNFEKCINKFSKNKKLGMIANYHLVLRKEYFDKPAAGKAKQYAQILGYYPKKYIFVAGTMFLCKAVLLKPIQKLNFKIEDFEIPDQNHKNSSLAHVMERLFGILVVSQGFKIQDALSIDNGFFYRKYFDILNFIYSKKLNSKGKLRIKIFKIPIYCQR